MYIGLLALLFASFIGGAVSPILVKFGVKEIPPLTFSALRFILATVIFSVFFFAQKNYYLNRNQIGTLFISSIPFTLNIAFFSVGIQFTTAIISQIFYATSSLVVAVLAYLFLQEKLSRYKFIGLIMALSGTIFLLQKSLSTPTLLTFGTTFGNVLILLAVLSHSIYLVISQKMMRNYTPQTTSFFSFLTTAFILTLVVPIELLIRPLNVENISTTGIYSLLGVALFSSALYFFLVQFGIKRTSAFSASLFHYTAPLLAAIASVPILGERLTESLVLGGLLILFGVFLATTYEQIRKYIRI